VFEIVSALVFRELIDDSTAEIPELIDRPFCSVSEQLLQLGKGQLDRIQIRRVRGQIAKLSADCFDRFADTAYFVAGEIVHHHDVA